MRTCMCLDYSNLIKLNRSKSRVLYSLITYSSIPTSVSFSSTYFPVHKFPLAASGDEAQLGVCR